MLKVGIIGLGDIAQKAYLPVLSSRAGAEFHLYTRDQARLDRICRQYRLPHAHPHLESLLASGIRGAFVHSSTESHFEIVQELLTRGIHVFVDKPIAYELAAAEKLVALAEEKKLFLLVGFNRRYAPAYRQLQETAEPNLILMQKNRASLPADPRVFVYDDFIHVLDTLRYLFPYPIREVVVQGRKQEGLLYHVVVQLVSDGATAIGIMNRDSGTTEERVEVMSPLEKRVVRHLEEITVLQGKEERVTRPGDWEPTLRKRGFEQMVDNFLRALTTGQPPLISARDALRTHELCEEVVEKLKRE